MYNGRSAGQVRLSFHGKNTNAYNAYNPYQQGQQIQYQQQPNYNVQPNYGYNNQQPLYPPLSPPVDLSNNGWGSFQPGSNIVPPNNSYGNQQFGNQQQFGYQQQQFGNQYPQYPQNNGNSMDYKLIQGMAGLFAPQQNNGWQNQNQYPNQYPNQNPYGKNNGW